MQNPSDPFAFIRNQWSGLGTGFQFPGQPLQSTSLEDLDRRIADLKTVEQWLNLNLNILKTTIQGLEIQRGTLVAVQSFQDAMGQFKPSAAGNDTAPPPDDDPKGMDSAEARAEQARRQATAWWESMQGQFQQLVQQAQSVTQATAQAADAAVQAGKDLTRAAPGAGPAAPKRTKAKAPQTAPARRRSTPK
jgi:hypothetical protein